MKEKDLQKAVIQWLQYQENLGKLYFIRNNTFRGQIMRKNGTVGFMRQGKVGCGDIIIFMPESRVIFAELKSDKGKLSLEQNEFRNRIDELGYEYWVIRSIDELEKIYDL
jgi:hypothetical protein